MPLGNCFRHAALACAISTALVTTGFGPAAADAGFRKWIQDFYGTAAKSGITRKTYNAVFDGITDVDQQVIEKANYQPEFSSEIWEYLDARVTKFTVAKGQEMRQKYKRWLDVIERRDLAPGKPSSGKLTVSIWLAQDRRLLADQAPQGATEFA